MSRPVQATTLAAISDLIADRPELEGIGISDALQVVTS